MGIAKVGSIDCWILRGSMSVVEIGSNEKYFGGKWDSIVEIDAMK